MDFCTGSIAGLLLGIPHTSARRKIHSKSMSARRKIHSKSIPKSIPKSMRELTGEFITNFGKLHHKSIRAPGAPTHRPTSQLQIIRLPS